MLTQFGKFFESRTQMKLFTKTKFESLSEAIERPNNCTTLTLLFIKDNLKDSGHSFIQLKNLKKLSIQGDPSIYYDYGFKLPKEIGQLKKLHTLSLLNLPITTFPDWILNLENLRYLMVRGTDINILPGSISRLNFLQTLRIENCPLKVLPEELNQLVNLKTLGLCDTDIEEIDSRTVPLSWKINLAMTPLHDTVPFQS